MPCVFLDSTFGPPAPRDLNGFLIGYSRSPIAIMREELVGKISKALDIDPDEIFKSRYLEFAEVYRAQGWSVVFETPDRGENYDSYWRFSAASQA